MINFHSRSINTFKNNSPGRNNIKRVLLNSVERSPLFRKRSHSRPRYKGNDKTTLVKEKQDLKEDNHRLKDENIKLKTRVLFLDKEIDQRDKLVEQTWAKNNISIKPKKASMIIKSSIVNNLKKQLRDWRAEVKILKTEVEKNVKDK